MKRLFEMVGELLGAKRNHAHYMELGANAYANQDFGEAEKEYTKALAGAEEARAHDDVAAISLQLGAIAEHLDKLAVAETHYRRAYQTEEDSEHHEQSAQALVILGRLYHKMRRFPDAEQVLQYSMTIYQQQFTARHPGIAIAAVCLADCYLDRKSYGEAEKLLLRAIEIEQREQNTGDTALCESMHKLALCLAEQNKDQQAEDMFKQTTTSFERNGSQFDTTQAHKACAFFHDFARFYFKHGKSKEALPLLHRAMALAEQYPGYLDEADLAEKIAFATATP